MIGSLDEGVANGAANVKRANEKKDDYNANSYPQL